MNDFFGTDTPPTKSAFCQARKKVKLSFYEAFFEQTNVQFEQYAVVKKQKNYRILAADTTVQKLPDNADTRTLGIHTNQHISVASVKLMTYYDVMNNLTFKATINNKKTADIRCAQPCISSLPKDTISIYDRGFEGHILAALHAHYGSKYVIRLSCEKSNVVKDFLASGADDVQIEERLQVKAVEQLRLMGFPCSAYDLISFRLVRVLLPTGETEVLMTNLSTEAFDVTAMGELYHQRWGVETYYNYLKNTLMLGTFSGYSAHTVQQDIWCNLIYHNLQSIAQLDCEAPLKVINERRKHDYKINRNVGAGNLREHLKILLTGTAAQIEKAVVRLQKWLLQSLERMKNSQLERARKRLRSNERHITELNYKRGF